MPALGEEALLQPLQPHVERVEPGGRLLLVLEPEAVGGVALEEVRLRAGIDPDALDHPAILDGALS